MCVSFKAWRLVATALLTTTCLYTSAQAMESWDPALRGVTVGVPMGAALPSGTAMFSSNFYWSAYNNYGNSGDFTGLKLDSFVITPTLQWNTGLKVLGADYSVQIVQPMNYLSLREPNSSALSANGHWGTFNTMITPAQLNWNLKNDFHVMANLTVYADDATSSPADPAGENGAGNGNSYWTLEPNVAVSWLHDGWNATLHLGYDYNLKDTSTHYKSGQFINVEYTLTKTFGNWTFGVGGEQQSQFTDDSGSGAADCAGGCRAQNAAIGPIFGYNFGKMKLDLTYLQNIYAKNDMGGSIINMRLTAPLTL